MRTISMFSVASLIAGLVACGGDAPAPKAEAPAAKEEAAKPADAPKEEAKEEAEPDLATMSEDEQKAYLMELGEKVYLGKTGKLACSSCHQANGEGLPPSFPPLKGALEFMKDCKTHAGWVINGLEGEIEVLGVTYNGNMPAQGNLSDLEIAAVITYERNAWGNEGDLCLPDVVASAR